MAKKKLSDAEFSAIAMPLVLSKAPYREIAEEIEKKSGVHYSIFSVRSRLQAMGILKNGGYVVVRQQQHV